MLPINKKLQLLIIGLACSIMAALVITVVVKLLPPKWNLMKSVDIAFYNLFFRPRLRPHSDLVVLDCHDPHEKRSRSDFARMIRQLHQAEAKLIAFDIRFVGAHQHDPQGDRELAQSVQGFPDVILAVDFAGDWLPAPNETNPRVLRKLAHLDSLALPEAWCGDLLPRNIAGRGVDLPYDSLFLATRHVGFINSLISEYHHFPPVLTFQRNRKCYASLPVAIAGKYFNAPDSLFEQIANNLDGDGQLLVNFIPSEEFQPFYFHYSWEDTSLDDHLSANQYRDKVVFVVNPSAETLVQTPLGAYPRWAILASLTSQLMLNRYIESSVIFAPAFSNVFLVFVGLLWLLFVAPRLPRRWRKTRLIFVAGTMLFILFIFVLLNFGRQWIGVGVPLLAFNLSMLVVRALYYRMIRAPQPEYRNLGLTVAEGQNRIYSIQIFESLGGEEQGSPTFQSFLEEENFKAMLEKLRKLEARQEDLEWMGGKLFDTIFQDGIFQHLKNGLEKAQNDERILRLKLRLDGAELVCLPWELMHTDKLSPSFLALHKRLSLTRYLPLDQPIPKRQFRIPLKILVVIASPLGLPELDVQREKRLIKKSLRSLIWAGDIRLRFCENATREKLMKELKREPHVLHYIGHGEFDAEKQKAFLLLESETQEPDKVDTKTLAVMLQERSVNLMVLNSCETASAASTDVFTGMAQHLVKVGIPAVVAMQYKILDDSALSFSQVFYPTLFRSNSIDAAVAEARQQILLQAKTGLNQQDWSAPVLFMRAPDGKIFEIDT